MLENGAPPDKYGVLYRLLHVEFHGFNSRIPCFILTQYFTDVMDPFNEVHVLKTNLRYDILK